MVSINNIQLGLSKFIDNELINKLEISGFKRLAIASVASLFIKRLNYIINNYKDNPLVSMLNLVDENGDIDVYAIYAEVKQNFPKDGIKTNIPLMDISITINDKDVDKLYCYITEKEM